MNLHIGSLTKHAETVMGLSFVLFFLVRYNLITAISVPTSMIAFGTTVLALSTIRFTYAYTHSQTEAGTSTRNSLRLASIDALLITSGGFGFLIFSTYGYFYAQILNSAGVLLFLTAIACFITKRKYVVDIYGTKNVPV